MAIETLNSFLLFLILPHLLTYLLYFVLKYTQLLYICIRATFRISSTFFKRLRTRPLSLAVDYSALTRGDPVDLNLIDVVLFSISLFYFCCCFCCCCCTKENLCCKAWKKAKHYRSKLDRWMIKILLGKQEGVVERFEDYKNDELDDDGLPKLYIRNKLLTPYEANVLALLIITFGILIAVTAFDLFFLDITHTCSENPKIYCFLINLTNLALNGSESDLNITNERITDCQYYWNNENISATFLCFRWAYKSEITSGAVGGLITIFRITVMITTGLFIGCCEKAIENPSKRDRNMFWIHIFRNLLALIVGCVEVTFAITFALTVQASLNSEEDSGSDMLGLLFQKHGNQVILIFGILGTCLLLPVEEYARSSIEQEHSSEEHQLNPSGND